jgi:hypothetical protein
MNYNELSQTIQDYVETTETLFVLNIPTFVKQAEERIYNTVQLPSLRKNVIGTATTSNKYLSCPNDYLSSFSMAVINPATNEYQYLLNKDVNFIREAYPNPNDTAMPKYYALFGTQTSNRNELSFILGPTPDANYQLELHYFYYPPTIVQGTIATTGTIVAGTSYSAGTYLGVNLTGGQGTGATADIVVSGGGVTAVTIRNPGSLYVAGDVLSAPSSAIGNTGSGFTVSVATIDNASGTSWLGDNYSPVLLYGAMREAVLFQKGEQDMVAYYEKQFQDALQQLNRLGTGLERGDAYRDGQAKIKVNP